MDKIIDDIRNTTNFYKNIDGSYKLDDKGNKLPKPPLKDSTIKSYSSTLNKIKEVIQTHDEKEYSFDDLSWLYNVNKVINIFKDLNLSDPTLKNYYNVIVVILKSTKDDIQLINRYSFLRDNLNKAYLKQQKTGIISDKQAPNFITKELYEEYIDHVENLPDSLGNLTLLSILKLYQFLPTRNELAELKIISRKDFNSMDVSEKTKSNWSVITDKNITLVIFNYKSDNTYGSYKEKLPKDLVKILKKMIHKKNQVFPDSHSSLFVNSKGTPLTKNSLSQMLIRSSEQYFKDKYEGIKGRISTTLIRKIYASHLSAEKNADQKKLAGKMKHSVDMNNLVYVKTPQPT
tara:strand:- start:4535 stop:5572 length:1038 start_codon:yes stop_codon:yes gene_type:complete